MEVLVVDGPEAEVSPEVEPEKNGVAGRSIEKKPRPSRPTDGAPPRRHEILEALGVRGSEHQSGIGGLGLGPEDGKVYPADLLELGSDLKRLALPGVAQHAKMRGPDFDPRAIRGRSR